MKREINMIASPVSKKKKENKNTALNKHDSEITTDPFGSWTGVCSDNKYEKPVQDADDL